MKKTNLLILCFIFCACSTNDERLKQLEEIKALGDTDPMQAISKLKPLNEVIMHFPEYYQAKYRLLEVRLHDKADIMPESDKKIKYIIEYFSENGSPSDLQETYYYAGSTYRDLHDYPSAINYFLSASKVADQNHAKCDSILLRNTYSNLCYLYNNVQDNSNYLLYAQKEYDLSLALGKIEDTSLFHLGDAYLLNDSVKEALPIFESVLSRQKSRPNMHMLSCLLNNYSFIADLPKAEECIILIDSMIINNHETRDAKTMMAYGWYYQTCGLADSAIIYFKNTLEMNASLEFNYDASRHLFYIYNYLGKQEEANHYGKLFCQISDSLNLGKRQEAAATISNLYKYYRDKEEEKDLKEKKKEYEYWFAKICLLVLVLISSSIGYILYLKNRHLKKVVKLMRIIEKANLDKETLTSVIQQKNIELKDAETIINKASCELMEKQNTLSNLNSELEQITSELNMKEQLLSTKIEQNKSFVRLLHQAELEKTAEEVIVTMKKSAIGRKSLSPNDWNQFYKAVDEIYPDFKSKISQKIDKVTDEQIKFCYLMRAGFTKSQIQNITGLARVTVWRWEKKYEWVYEEP